VYLPRQDSRPAHEAQRFARAGTRCTEGPLGERVCMASGPGQPAVAVSALEAPALAGLLASLSH
jgi:hypothetical protein